MYTKITGNYLKSHDFNLAEPENVAHQGYRNIIIAQHISVGTWYKVLYLIADLPKKSNTQSNQNEVGSFICLAL